MTSPSKPTGDSTSPVYQEEIRLSVLIPQTTKKKEGKKSFKIVSQISERKKMRL